MQTWAGERKISRRARDLDSGMIVLIGAYYTRDTANA